MSLMSQLFHIIFYQPLLNALVGLNILIPDLGISIIILTVLIKLILWPLSEKALKNQLVMQKLHPELEDLKVKYKENKEILAKETLEAYKRHKTSPTGSCLALLIQLPFILAIFNVFQAGLTTIERTDIYSFIPFSGKLNPITLGLIDLTQPSWIIAALAAAAQFWQSWQMQKLQPAPIATTGSQGEIAAIMSKQMLYVLPFMTLFIGSRFPSGLAVYWVVQSLMSILQTDLFFRIHHKTQNQIGIIDIPAKLTK